MYSMLIGFLIGLPVVIVGLILMVVLREDSQISLYVRIAGIIIMIASVVLSMLGLSPDQLEKKEIHNNHVMETKAEQEDFLESFVYKPNFSSNSIITSKFNK